MSLHAKLLALLSTPAARAASDADTRRAVERALDTVAPAFPVLCPECKDQEARAWRRHAEIELGDDDATRTATDQQLRRSITQKIEDQAHTIDVMAELAAAGDIAGIRMHFEHHKGAPRG